MSLLGGILGGSGGGGLLGGLTGGLLGGDKGGGLLGGIFGGGGGGGLLDGILGGGKGGGLFGGIVGKLLNPLGLLGGNQDQGEAKEMMGLMNSMVQSVISMFK